MDNQFPNPNSIDWETQSHLIEREILKQYTQFFRDSVEEFTYDSEEDWWEINGIIRASIEEILWDEGFTVMIKFEVFGAGQIEEEEITDEGKNSA